MKLLYTAMFATLSISISADIDIGTEIIDNPAYTITEIKISETARYKITTKELDAQQGISLIIEYAEIAQKRGYNYFTVTNEKDTSVITFYRLIPVTKKHIFNVKETLKLRLHDKKQNKQNVKS